jgi:hypothetical protein
VRRPAKSQPKPNAYVGPDAEGPFRGVCTAAVGFCCRTAPLPPLPPPPPVEPLNPGKVSSKFFGVGWNKSKRKWRAYVKHNGIRASSSKRRLASGQPGAVAPVEEPLGQLEGLVEVYLYSTC